MLTDHLVLLPAGDAALTRRAKEASALSAVVVRFSRSRRRYERRWLLVEPAALDQADQDCLADEARSRRRQREEQRRCEQDLEFLAELDAEIRQLFPACPPERVEAIAKHAGIRRFGRIGRSAAGPALDPVAVSLAVVASAQHDGYPLRRAADVSGGSGG